MLPPGAALDAASTVVALWAAGWGTHASSPDQSNIPHSPVHPPRAAAGGDPTMTPFPGKSTPALESPLSSQHPASSANGLNILHKPDMAVELRGAKKTMCAVEGVHGQDYVCQEVMMNAGRGRMLPYTATYHRQRRLA